MCSVLGFYRVMWTLSAFLARLQKDLWWSADGQVLVSPFSDTFAAEEVEALGQLDVPSTQNCISKCVQRSTPEADCATLPISTMSNLRDQFSKRIDFNCS